MKEKSLEVSNLVMPIGSTHKQTFSGLGTAGYAWDFMMDGSTDILSVSHKTEKTPVKTIPSTYDNNDIYNIIALKPGEVRVRFFLHRPWEHEKPPLREVIINVSVV